MTIALLENTKLTTFASAISENLVTGYFCIGLNVRKSEFISSGQGHMTTCSEENNIEQYPQLS